MTNFDGPNCGVVPWCEREVGHIGDHAPRPDIRLAAKEFRDAHWALRILDGDGLERLDPRWNAAVERFRTADAALAAALDETSPFA